MTDFQTRRAQFGARLRELRERAGTSGRDLAATLGWTQSKVSKIETGRQTPDDADVIEWCDTLDASASQDELLAELSQLRVQQVAWRRELRAGHKTKQNRIARREQLAKRIRAVDIAAVTGLLQTADYARAVFDSQASLLEVPHDTEQAIGARVQRQQILYDTDKHIEILIGEAALLHPIAPPEVMLVQIDRLLSVTGLPHVRFGVLPVRRQLPHLLLHGYWIVDDHVSIETTTTESDIDDPDQVATYHRLTDRLWTVAAEDDAAREILRRAAEGPTRGT